MRFLRAQRAVTDTGGSGLDTGLFFRLYRRLDDRYLAFLISLVAVWIPGFWPAAAAFALPYFDQPLGEYLGAIALWMPWMVLVAIAAVAPAWRKVCVPGRDWIRRGRPGSEAADIWLLAVDGVPRFFLLGTVITILGSAPPTIYLCLSVDLPILGYPAALALMATAVLTVTAANFLICERAVQPLVVDAARRLPEGFKTGRRTLSISNKLIMVVPIACVMTAFIANALAGEELTPAASLAAGAGLAVFVTAVVALPLTLMLRRSLLHPMADLLRAMGKVERGDLDARLPIVAGDETGVIAQHFNSMLRGLHERERLSDENAELHARIRAQLEEVHASRARIIAASDAERRRVERNIHDGAQQRLVALALELRLLEAEAATSGDQSLRNRAATARENLSAALGELRDLARGLHPQVLTTDGLGPAVRQLAERAPIPVKVDATNERFSDPVESTAYFVVSEALANVGKYAQASQAEVTVERRNGALHVEVEDDGVGGADPDSGSGLSGLKDRVAALDGSLEVQSERGSGTKVRVELPLSATVD